MAATTIQVQIGYTVPAPGGYLLLVGVADGVPIQVSVRKAEYDALPNLAARRQYVAQKLADVLTSFLTGTEPGLPGIIPISVAGTP